jgi:hypothetical protein
MITTTDKGADAEEGMMPTLGTWDSSGHIDMELGNALGQTHAVSEEMVRTGTKMPRAQRRTQVQLHRCTRDRVHDVFLDNFHVCYSR